MFDNQIVMKKQDKINNLLLVLESFKIQYGRLRSDFKREQSLRKELTSLLVEKQAKIKELSNDFWRVNGQFNCLINQHFDLKEKHRKENNWSIILMILLFIFGLSIGLIL